MNAALPALDTGRLAGLIFELASQLHAERLHRLALEQALMRAGVIEAGALAKLAKDPVLRATGRREVAESVARMMQIVAEQEESYPRGGAT